MYLIGVRLDPKTADADVYYLGLYGLENEKPLTSDGRVIFFTDPKMAPAVAQLGGPAFAGCGPIPTSPELVCDVPEAVHLIEGGRVDHGANVLNCFNMLIDMFKATGVKLPSHHKRVLNPLHEHLTTSRRFGAFLEARGISREAVAGAFYWCLGAMLAKSRLAR